MLKLLVKLDRYLSSRYAMTDPDPWFITAYSYIMLPVYGWYRLKRRISRIISYIPILYNLNDYDWAYCVEIYIFQLKRLDKLLNESPIVSYNETQKRRMLQYIESLTRLKDGTTDDIVMDEFYRKWGQPDYDFGSNFLINRTHEKLTIVQKNRYNKELKLAIKEVQIREQNLWDFVNKFNSKYLRKYWE